MAGVHGVVWRQNPKLASTGQLYGWRVCLLTNPELAASVQTAVRSPKSKLLHPGVWRQRCAHAVAVMLINTPAVSLPASSLSCCAEKLASGCARLAAIS